MSDRTVRLRFLVESAELDKPKDQLEQLVRLEKELVEAIKQASLSSRTDSAQQVTAINAVSDALQKQKKATDDTNKATKETSDNLNVLSSGVKSFVGLVAGAFAISEIKSFGQSIIEAKTQVDSIHVSLQTMLGSRREADELYAKMVTLAKQTPFSLAEVSEQVVKLKAYNISTADLIPTITALGNIAAAVGKEKLPQLTLAYGQIATTGKLMGDELNQLREVGVPILDMIAKSYGKTAEEVQKMADDHTISFAMVRKAILDSSAEGGKFQDMMLKMSKTVGGSVGNLSDDFVVAKARIGDFFEDQIAGGTKILQNLIQTLAGSQAAIQRTVTFVESIAVAFVTWRTAMNAAKIQQEVVTAATKAGEVAMGTYNLLMITIKGTTEGFTRAQQESAVASRALWSGLAANPIGAIITVVGLATSAYLAWSAATTEVADAMGEQEFQLRKEQSELNALVKAAMDAEEGTTRRKDAIQELINKYPDYFAGLSTEKTSNNQLRTILENVNASYRDRIDLAREAYKTDKLAEQQKALFEQEAELLERVKKTNALNEEVVQSFGGSAKKLLDYMKANGQAAMDLNSQWDTLFKGTIGEAARNIVKQQGEIEKGYATSAANMQTIREKEKTSAIATEEAKHKAIMQQLADGSKEEQAETERFNIAISKLNGTYRETELKETITHEDKKKQITVLSAKEIAVLLKQEQQESFNDRIKYLDAEEKAEIEAVNKVTVSRKITAAERKALEKQISEEILQIHEDFNKRRAVIIEEERRIVSRNIQTEIDSFQSRNAGQRDYVDQTTKGYKEIAKEAEETEKRIQQLTKETAEITKETGRIQEETRKAGIQFLSSFLVQQGGLIGNIGQGFFSVFQSIDLLSGKSQKAADDAVTQAKNNYDLVKAAFDNNIRGTEESVASAFKKYQDTLKNAEATKLETLQAVTGVFGQIYQVLTQVATFINDKISESWRAIAEGITRTREVYNEFFEFVRTQSKETYDRDLENFKGPLAEKMSLIDAHYQKELELSRGQQKLDAQLQYLQAFAELNSKAGQSAKDLIEGVNKIEVENLRIRTNAIIAQAEIEKEYAADIRDAKIAAIDAALQKDLDAKQKEIDNTTKTKDKNIALIREQMEEIKAEYQALTDEVRNNYSRQLEALREQQSAERAEIQATYDLKQQLLNQATADQIEAVSVIDRLRNEAVERYRIAEVAILTATRDRILATLTDEGERAQITEEYARRIQGVHDQVEQAKLDKTLGVSLATKQINRENKEDAERLKTEEKDAITKLDEDYQVKFKALADERDAKLEKLKNDSEEREQKLRNQITDLEAKAANEIEEIREKMAKQEAAAASDRLAANTEFTNQVLKANKAILEAQKAIKIAELRAQIAVLESQKGLFANNSAINAAIGAINQAISEITAITVDTGTVGTVTISSRFGKTNYAAKEILADIKNNGGGQVNGGGNNVGNGGGIDLGPKNKPGGIGDLIKTATDAATGEPVAVVYDEKSNRIEITYSEGHEFDAFKNDGTPIRVKDGKGYSAQTGKSYFLGTSFVELGDNPKGRDTVPAMVNEGERIVPTVLNKVLGGKKLSNEELVDKVLFSERFAEAFPQMANLMPTAGNMIMKLPDELMQSQSIDVSGIRKDLKALRSDMQNLKQVQINMDKNGFSTALLGTQSKTEYYNNFFKQ